MFRFRIAVGLFALAVVVICRRVEDDDEVDNREKTKCPFDTDEVELLFQESKNVEKDKLTLEVKLVKQGKVLKSNQRVADISLIRQVTRDPINRIKELKQLLFVDVTKKLIQKYKLSSAEVDSCLSELLVEGVYGKRARDECMKNVFSGKCDPKSVYRTADGTCNNLENPRWGSVGSCSQRLLSPNYEGESGFRQSVEGGPLPDPRTISLGVHSHLNKQTNYVNHLYTFFGQLLTHDVTFHPISVTMDNKPIRCCDVDEPLHPQCAPIRVQPKDPFYSRFGITCLNFVRSAICPTCTLGSRQQSNQITAFIDASFIYGNSLNKTRSLRDFDDPGTMRVEASSFGDLLPPSPNPSNDGCSFIETGDTCFVAGDSRVNQHPPLASLHTIFLREHNRLAYGLRQMNPTWDGETLFQEARKIVGAQMQAIAFDEYLPITLGHEWMTNFDLYLRDKGWTNYNREIDPTVYNEFSVAAFRFGHSLVNDVIANSPRNANNGTMLLRNLFFQPFDLRKGIISPLMVGLTKSPSQLFDRHLVPDVTNYMYRVRGQPTGLDLASSNIQRGRDHGIATYVDVVSYCSHRKIKINHFQDLVTTKLMTKKHAKRLSQYYKNVKDIDLWTGILSEIIKDGAVVGPTAACIIADQFASLKFGDRFYFEHRNQVGSFTYQQIEEIRKTKLSTIICLNTDVAKIPMNAMIFESENNPLIKCPEVKGVDLSYWG